MVNNQIYEELVQKYKSIAQEFKETIETTETKNVQERVGKLMELEILLIENIEKLSLDELTKLRHYHDLADEVYRHHLEFTWRGRF